MSNINWRTPVAHHLAERFLGSMGRRSESHMGVRFDWTPEPHTRRPHAFGVDPGFFRMPYFRVLLKASQRWRACLVLSTMCPPSPRGLA